MSEDTTDMHSDDSSILLTREGALARVRFNRPASLNAMGFAMGRLWRDIAREITSDDEVFDRSAAEIKKFYPIVITQIYQAIMDLEREFAELAIKLGKLSG